MIFNIVEIEVEYNLFESFWDLYLVQLELSC